MMKKDRPENENHATQPTIGGESRGKILLLVGLLVVAAVAFYLRRGDLLQSAFLAAENPAVRSLIGAPRAEAFDLSRCVVPTETILSGGPRKDGIPALVRPKRVKATQAFFLKPEDRVIGVEFGGESVAYPIRILNYHECANDIVAGKAIAVTYCPLCDSAFVFDRDIGDEVLEFGISGLLLNSNVLLYDRRDSAQEESLWSQVAMRAVCGPAAEASQELSLLPSEYVTWGDWKKRHSTTEVLSVDTGHARNYRGTPYTQYFLDDRLMFPVIDLFEVEESVKENYARKEPALVVRDKGKTKVYPFEELSKAANGEGRVEDRFGSTTLSILYDSEGPSARIASSDPTNESLESAYTFWFAWRSLQDGYEMFRAP